MHLTATYDHEPSWNVHFLNCSNPCNSVIAEFSLSLLTLSCMYLYSLSLSLHLSVAGWWKKTTSWFHQMVWMNNTVLSHNAFFFFFWFSCVISRCPCLAFLHIILDTNVMEEKKKVRSYKEQDTWRRLGWWIAQTNVRLSPSIQGFVFRVNLTQLVFKGKIIIFLWAPPKCLCWSSTIPAHEITPLFISVSQTQMSHWNKWAVDACCFQPISILNGQIRQVSYFEYRDEGGKSQQESMCWCLMTMWRWIACIIWICRFPFIELYSEFQLSFQLYSFDSL